MGGHAPADSALPSLAGAAWLADADLQRVMAALGGGGDGDTRIVGGAVRNTLFGFPVKDIDLATRLPPDEVMARAGRARLKAVPTGIDHGTVTVISSGRPFEVTTLRVDVETYGRHARVAFTDDWREDARRRDFTINALYADADGTLYDPLGGYPDVLARRIRFIGDADARIGEDYLRILRFFRFNAEYGQGPLDRHGLAAAVRGRAGLAQLSPERIRQEMLRLVAAADPLAAVTAMADSGIAQIVLGGVAYLGPFGQLLEVERRQGLAGDGVLRLTLLACAVSEDAERLFTRLRLSRAEYERMAAAGDGWARFTPQMDVLARKAALYRLGGQTYRDRVVMAWCRRAGAADDAAWRELLRLPEHWQPPELPWRGKDLKARGLAAGKQLGAVLRAAEEAWITAGFPGERDRQEAILQQALAGAEGGS